MTLKMAVLAPMPKPRIRIAVIVNPGDFKSGRNVWRKRLIISIAEELESRS